MQVRFASTFPGSHLGKRTLTAAPFRIVLASSPDCGFLSWCEAFAKPLIGNVSGETQASKGLRLTKRNTSKIVDHRCSTNSSCKRCLSHCPTFLICSQMMIDVRWDHIVFPSHSSASALSKDEEHYFKASYFASKSRLSLFRGLSKRLLTGCSPSRPTYLKHARFRYFILFDFTSLAFG